MLAGHRRHREGDPGKWRLRVHACVALRCLFCTRPVHGRADQERGWRDSSLNGKACRAGFFAEMQDPCIMKTVTG